MLKRFFWKRLKKSVVHLILYTYKFGVVKATTHAIIWLEKKLGGYQYHSLMRLKISSINKYLRDDNARGKYIEIEPAKTITIEPVHVFGLQLSHLQCCYMQQHTVKIPEKYIGEINNVKLLGGTELIIADDKFALYDELAFYNKNHYGVKNIYVVSDYSPTNRPLLNLRNELLLRIKTQTNRIGRMPEQPRPSAVISLCKDYAVNYFHWLTECLPKMKYIDENIDPSIPLLIEADHPDQNIEALSYLNRFQRKIYLIQRGYIEVFKKVYYVSAFSHSHENLLEEVHPEDLMIPPETVAFLREKFLSEDFLGEKLTSSNQERMKLYISREDSTYRRLINEGQIQEKLKKAGFVIVKTAKLSFKEQVRLFSKASVIVGPSGAGLTNILFAPKDCSVFVLTSNVYNANFYSYASLAQHAGIYLEYLIGKAKNRKEMHSDFEMPLPLIEESLKPTVYEFTNV